MNDLPNVLRIIELRQHNIINDILTTGHLIILIIVIVIIIIVVVIIVAAVAVVSVIMLPIRMSGIVLVNVVIGGIQ